MEQALENRRLNTMQILNKITSSFLSSFWNSGNVETEKPTDKDENNIIRERERKKKRTFQFDKKKKMV